MEQKPPKATKTPAPPFPKRNRRLGLGDDVAAVLHGLRNQDMTRTSSLHKRSKRERLSSALGGRS